MSATEQKHTAIRLGDTTNHGGVVISASTSVTIHGLVTVACVGDMVKCPQCGGVYPIVEGDANSCYVDSEGNKRAMAMHGNKTACGVKLVSSC